MKKVYKPIGIIFVILLIVLGLEIYKFNTKEIDGPIIFEQEEYYEERDISLMKKNVYNKKSCFISKVYLIESNSKMQIRFRYLSITPFIDMDTIKRTDFILKDSKGNKLNFNIMTYSETFWGFSGLNIDLIPKEDENIPKSGETLYLTIASSRDKYSYLNIKKDKCFSYCEIEIPIP